MMTAASTIAWVKTTPVLTRQRMRMTYIVTPATLMAIILRDKRKWDFYEISPKHKFKNRPQR
mgnify:CR=1 FL=1